MKKKLIALIGVDGSGKTSVSEALKDYFESQGRQILKLSVFNYVLLRPLIFIGRLLRRGEKGGSLHPNPLLASRNKNPFLKIWPFLVLIDNWVYFWLKVKSRFFKVSLLVTDKYFYDMAASFMYFGYSSKIIDRLYAKFIPRPDLVFVLDVPAEVAFERKKELSLEYYRVQRGYYLELAHRFDFLLIDANRLLEAVVDNVIGRIDSIEKGKNYD